MSAASQPLSAKKAKEPGSQFETCFTNENVVHKQSYWPDAIAREHHELVSGLELDRTDVRHRRNHLLFQRQTFVCFVAVVAWKRRKNVLASGSGVRNKEIQRVSGGLQQSAAPRCRSTCSTRILLKNGSQFTHQWLWTDSGPRSLFPVRWRDLRRPGSCSVPFHLPAAKITKKTCAISARTERKARRESRDSSCRTQTSLVKDTDAFTPYSPAMSEYLARIDLFGSQQRKVH